MSGLRARDPTAAQSAPALAFGRDVLRARIALLQGWVQRCASAEGSSWFNEVLDRVLIDENTALLMRALALAPRRVGKADLALTEDHLRRAEEARPGFDPTGFSVDEAARIALLLASYRDPASFARTFDVLVRTADLREHVAYYRGFALFPASGELTRRAAEGVRSGMRPVFEAIAHRNPYPRENFDDAAWNQMVVKALFIGSELHPIQGLDERASSELSAMLVDYAHERWAAQRPISIELWRALGRFVDERGVQALERLLRTGDQRERAAAALALKGTGTEEAAAILASEGALAEEVAKGRITWETLRERSG